VSWARDGEVLTLEFEAEDPMKRAQWEAQLALAEPPPTKTNGIGKVERAAVGCVVAPLLLYGACLAHSTRPALQVTGGLMAVFLILSLALLETFLKRRAAVPRRALPTPTLTSRFTLCITPATFTLSADGRVVRQVALADIADVTAGDHHVALIHQDGSHTDLPITRYAFANDEMAADIRAGIREVRALGTDYRGGKLTS
jgi:hypothetical protein